MRFVFIVFAVTAWAQSHPAPPPLSYPAPSPAYPADHLVSQPASQPASHPASHPAWWTYASPEATALVGMRWDSLRDSALAGPLEAELDSDNAPGFWLECLKQSRQFLLSAPDFLAIAYGDFPTPKLRVDAAAKGLKRVWYKGVDLWVAPGQSLSIAPLNSQILLMGERKTLEAAIDRIPTEKTASEGGRQYSPLLARAAEFAEKDFWVVAAALPDPLANRFVPFDADALGFAGGVSVSRGLHVEATLEASSAQAATDLAVRLQQDTASLPSVARGLQITTNAETVSFALDVTSEQLQSSLRPRSAAEAEPVTGPAPPAAPATPAVAVVEVNGKSMPVDPVLVDAAPVPSPVAEERAESVPVPSVLSKPTASAALPPASPEPPKPPQRQVIRIFGLDDGVREIELPPAPGSTR